MPLDRAEEAAAVKGRPMQVEPTPLVRTASLMKHGPATPAFVFLLAATALVGIGCADSAAADQDPPMTEEPPTEEAQDSPNTLTEEERGQGFQLLFDGHTLNEWRGFRREGVPTAWIVEDGAIHFTAEGERGDIITDETYEDFELRLEWKISPGGNSGIMFGVSETTRRTYEAGPEMQVLDNAGHPDGAAPVTSAGSNYALHAPRVDATRPVGEWNEVRLMVVERQVEHWLNGQQIVTYQLGSDDWERLVAESKFAQWPEYGRQAKGHIALQDHGNHVWYRTIRIRRIEP